MTFEEKLGVVVKAGFQVSFQPWDDHTRVVVSQPGPNENFDRFVCTKTSAGEALDMALDTLVESLKNKIHGANSLAAAHKDQIDALACVNAKAMELSGHRKT